MKPTLPSTEDAWDLVIEPRKRWFELNLRDLWRYRDLVRMFVWRDFTAQYKQTILGPLWHIIQPLITAITFTVIFGRVAKLPTDGLPPFLFYMTGNVVWAYFSTCLTATSNTFIGNAHIFGKVYFPRIAVPVSIVISRLIGFAIQFSIYLMFLAWYAWRGFDVKVTAVALLTPLLLVLMGGLGLGLGILVSSMTTRYRDLQQLVGFGVQLAMYATPIVYPLSLVGEKYRWLVLANPMTPIVETFRVAFLGAGTFDPLHLLYSTVFMVVLMILSLALFNRVEKTFMDTV
jgi:lipopolysaccharide transport system permease protein